MKCLPAAKISEASGYILHDWHAEMLALRSFNHFLLQECAHLLRSPEYRSKILQWRISPHKGDGHEQPFAIRDDVRIHMYCSEAPCGDASMELIIEAQEDASPWPVKVVEGGQPSVMLGRGNFSELGVVRRKPGNEADLS